jgi:signal transduction histidine kinase
VVGFGATGVLVVKPLVLFDLLGALLLAAQVVLLGQAIVSYEVFTGKTLPRRGLARYWRNALILAAGFGGLMAISLGLPLDQSYRLTLALVIVAIFYALLSWRSFVERERSLDQLRPFVASDRLVDHLLATEAALADRTDPAPGPLKDPFRALCDGLLGARVAYLCPAGPLASLVGAPLAVPSGASPPSAEVLAKLAAGIGTSRQLCLPIDPTTYGGAAWVVPLWGERSLIGLLLLGDRWDGSLYAQEEMEIARAAGERLIDARAAGELARRLLLLQRRRLADDQLMDGRVRRALHDDVLPLLHTALLSLNGRPQQPGARLNGAVATPTEAAGLLADAHRQVSALLAALPPALAPDVARLGLAGALRRVVDDLGGEIDGVTWEIPPAGARAAADLSPLAAEVLFGAAREAIRNAARHGRGAAPDDARRSRLRVAIGRADDGLTVLIEDDGVGLAGRERAPGDQPGGGQGLVLHGTLLTVIGGSMAVESAPGHGTRVTLRVPSPG